MASEELAKATAEANAVFGRLGAAVDAAVEGNDGSKPVDVLDIARKAEIKIDAATLDRLEIPRLIYPIVFCHWCGWYPWRPLWCWWWRVHYPHIRCCPYWWHRCHPYVLY
jgi:hypothetical protein